MTRIRNSFGEMRHLSYGMIIILFKARDRTDITLSSSQIIIKAFSIILAALDSCVSHRYTDPQRVQGWFEMS